MQQEVTTQVATDDVSSTVLGKKHDSLMHLVVCYETVTTLKVTSFIQVLGGWKDDSRWQNLELPVWTPVFGDINFNSDVMMINHHQEWTQNLSSYEFLWFHMRLDAWHFRCPHETWDVRAPASLNVPVFHDVQVPQLHHFLLSLIDICELV